MRKFCPSCGEVCECHRIATQDVRGEAEARGHVDEINVYECCHGHTFTRAEKAEESASVSGLTVY